MKTQKKQKQPKLTADQSKLLFNYSEATKKTSKSVCTIGVGFKKVLA